MQKLIVLAFIGFIAQLVDGALGMAYGVTSTSLLLLSGIAPAVASASVHMAEVVTTAASGISHLKFGNVDKEILKKIIIPGSIGAFTGACFLSHIPGEAVKPFISVFLLSLGFFVIYRFVRKGNKPGKKRIRPKRKQLVPLGFAAGFLDATGGGGWGPVATPVLLANHKMEPRKVIGTVDTSEFFIAVSATLGFIISLGWEQISFQWVLALMIGGIFAAPIAAWLVKIFPSVILGTLVGGVIILTNTRVLLSTLKFSGKFPFYIYGKIILLWFAAIISLWLRFKREKQ